MPAMALLVAAPLAGIAAWRRWGAVLVYLVVSALILFTAMQSVPKQVRAFRLMHSQAMAGSNRILEEFLSSLAEEPRLTFVDTSTYHRSSALLVNEPDLTGTDVVAIYRRPEQNRAVINAFPGRRVHLFRWDRLAKEVRFEEYVPEEDDIGPPRVYPHRRRQFRTSYGAGPGHGDVARGRKQG
jgi:hypothetical protein